MTDISTTPPPVQSPPQSVVREPRSKWPVVVGTVSIVIAATGLVCTPMGMLFSTLAGTFGRQSPDVNLPYPYFLLEVVKIIISVLLLVAGINLVRRRRLARILHLVWAIVRIPSILIGVIGAYSVFYRADQTSSPHDEFAFLMIIPITMGAMLAVAWPVFVLIWFNRTKIKQQVAEW